MIVKVYRSNKYIQEVEAVRTSQNELAYIEGVSSGDILVVVSDGARLKVLWNNDNPGGLRDGLRFSLINDEQ